MSTDIPAHLEMREGYAVSRASGEVSLAEAIQAVTAAIVAAREQGVKKLLVDISGLSGFEPPSIASRYEFVNEWARAARGAVSVVLVAQKQMIHPQKLGVIFANSAGLVGEVFSSEDAAVTWLKGRP